jgi:DNA-binding NarL/FixJ family response regulator
LKTIEFTPITAARNCFRCGKEFRALSASRVCSICRKPKVSQRKSFDKQLSLRDQQVIDLVRQAKLNKEIAYELHLTEGTIKEYMNRIFRKLGVKNRTQLAVWSLMHAGVQGEGRVA